MNASKLTTFYIVRHGETDWNNKKLLQGFTDIALNKTGENQAKDLAVVLKDVKFDLAFSSDLVRAKKTAEIIVLEKKLAVETTRLLRERTFGKFEGKPLSDFHSAQKLLKDLSYEQRRTHHMAEDMESDEEVARRVFTFIREIAIANLGKTILLTTHGGVLRTILIHLGQMSYEESDNSKVSNGAYVVLETDGVDFFVKKVTGFKPR